MIQKISKYKISYSSEVPVYYITTNSKLLLVNYKMNYTYLIEKDYKMIVNRIYKRIIPLSNKYRCKMIHINIEYHFKNFTINGVEISLEIIKCIYLNISKEKLRDYNFKKLI